ncbi:MAG: YlbF family regulator [Gemmatimonadaceae bacterium]
MLSEKAMDVGRLIGQSPEYQAVKRANEALNADKEVVAALQRMEALRHEAQAVIERGEQPSAEMEQELDQLLTKVQASMLYQRFIAANENFDKVMVQVNQWMLDGIKKGAASSIITLG